VAERSLVARGRGTSEERTEVVYEEDKYDLRNILKLKEAQRKHENVKVSSFFLLSPSFESDSNKMSPT